MFKLVETGRGNKTIFMRDLAPCELAEVAEGRSAGHIVMRTASLDHGHAEVVNLTKPGPGQCWTGGLGCLVKPLPVGTRITIEVI